MERNIKRWIFWIVGVVAFGGLLIVIANLSTGAALAFIALAAFCFGSWYLAGERKER